MCIDDEDYESDSAITAAANKSLDLSRSLGDKCADFTQSDSSDEEEAESVSQHDSGPLDLQVNKHFSLKSNISHIYSYSTRKKVNV